jgi:hypothetical protein
VAKTKDQLLDEAKKSGRLADDVEPDELTAAQLEQIVGGDVPVPGAGVMHNKPQVAPDGHVNLSQEDIDGRDS